MLNSMYSSVMYSKKERTQQFNEDLLRPTKRGLTVNWR